MAGKLTFAKIRALTAPGRYGDGGGLWLQVRDAQHRSWLFRYMLQGKSRWMGLGPVNDVSLAEARDKARDARRVLLDGGDPLAGRKAARAAAAGVTFREVAAKFIASREATWKNAVHRAQWGSTLETYVYPEFGGRAVSTIATQDVLAVLEPIWSAKAETASRLRGRIEAVLDYATAMGWRIGDNPARLKGHLDALLAKRSRSARIEHHPALPWAELPAFMVRLHGERGLSALALRWTISTAARTGEAIGATWEEIDLEAKAWTIPAARMKAGVEHRVPLSSAALDVLAELPTREGFLFPGAKRGKALSNMAMLVLLRRMNRADLTVHGFRSTFRDWAAEATAYPRELAEAALAHTLRDKVEAAYRRGDLFEKRRALMTEWANYKMVCSRE